MTMFMSGSVGIEVSFERDLSMLQGKKSGAHRVRIIELGEQMDELVVLAPLHMRAVPEERDTELFVAKTAIYYALADDRTLDVKYDATGSVTLQFDEEQVQKKRNPMRRPLRERR